MDKNYEQAAEALRMEVKEKVFAPVGGLCGQGTIQVLDDKVRV